MKLPFDLSLKFVFRLLLPGFILATAFEPVLQTILKNLGVTGQAQIGYVASALVWGWLVIVIDMHIYMLYEGRRYWPGFLRNWMLGREKSRLARLLTDAEQGASLQVKREASVELRRFPIDEASGQFTAEYPTRLGNLLSAFEDYSNRIYGMDSVFYWPRLWLVLDKDSREEIDSLQAMADSTTYASFAFYVTGLAGLVYAALKALRVTAIEFLPETRLLVGLGIAFLLLGYVTYRVSLHLHAQFGETFKAVFDLYHEKVLFPDVLAEVGRLTGEQHPERLPAKLQYRKVWRYLHNYRVKLTEDGKSYLPKEIEPPAPASMAQASQGQEGPRKAAGIGLLLAGLAVQLWKAFRPKPSRK